MPTKKKSAEAAPTTSQEDVAIAEAPEDPETLEKRKKKSELDEIAAEQKTNDPLAPSTLAFERGRITQLDHAEPDATSFQFEKEDHTLGNALRYIIMKNPDVEFCGYSIPHPSEELMNLRIQTYEGTAIEALTKGLNDLIDLCDVVADKFKDARVDFMAGRETPDSV